MANEIDLYKDLVIMEKKRRLSKTKGEKKIWDISIKELVKEIKTQYPDLAC